LNISKSGSYFCGWEPIFPDKSFLKGLSYVSIVRQLIVEETIAFLAFIY